MADMTNTRLELCNMIRMEAEHTEDTGFPLEVFPQTVQSVIEEQYGVTHEELIGPRRNANIAKARHIAIYLAIEMCEMTTTAVGAEFGNRNHSTVSTSYKKVQKMIQEDRTVTEDLKSLRDKITLRS